MQSLYLFMRKKRLHTAVRTSLENFGAYDYTDPIPENNNLNPLRHIEIYPLYALSQLTTDTLIRSI